MGLKVLSLRGNLLRALPASVGKMVVLEKVYLTNNPDLQHPPPEMHIAASYTKEGAQRVVRCVHFATLAGDLNTKPCCRNETTGRHAV
jgi:hypothetical protein